MSGKKWLNPTYYKKDNGKNQMLPVYSAWIDMKQRCTSDRARSKRPTYNDVSMCSEWESYDVFYEWAHKQQGFNQFDEGHRFQLDKDLLSGKIYGPDTCVFIPKRLNQFAKRNVKGYSQLPNGKWRADIFDHDLRKNVLLGCFETEVHARIAYNVAKADMALRYADRYEGLVDPRCIEALKNW